MKMKIINPISLLVSFVLLNSCGLSPGEIDQMAENISTDDYHSGYNDGIADGTFAGFTAGFEVGTLTAYEDGFKHGYNDEYIITYDLAYEDGYHAYFSGYPVEAKLRREQSPFRYELGYTDGYSVAYDTAYENGFFDGSTDQESYWLGYEDGLPPGADDGYEDGFNDGWNQAREDDFLNCSVCQILPNNNPVPASIHPLHLEKREMMRPFILESNHLKALRLRFQDEISQTSN